MVYGKKVTFSANKIYFSSIKMKLPSKMQIALQKSWLNCIRKSNMMPNMSVKWRMKSQKLLIPCKKRNSLSNIALVDRLCSGRKLC